MVKLAASEHSTPTPATSPSWLIPLNEAEVRIRKAAAVLAPPVSTPGPARTSAVFTAESSSSPSSRASRKRLMRWIAKSMPSPSSTAAKIDVIRLK